MSSAKDVLASINLSDLAAKKERLKAALEEKKRKKAAAAAAASSSSAGNNGGNVNGISKVDGNANVSGGGIGSGSSSTFTPQLSAAKHVLRLDAQGREIDEHGNLVQATVAPTTSSLINQRAAMAAAEQESQNRLQAARARAEHAAEKAKFVDERLSAPRTRRAPRQFEFVQPGTFLERGERMRAKAVREEVMRGAGVLGSGDAPIFEPDEVDEDEKLKKIVNAVVAPNETTSPSSSSSNINNSAAAADAAAAAAAAAAAGTTSNKGGPQPASSNNNKEPVDVLAKLSNQLTSGFLGDEDHHEKADTAGQLSGVNSNNNNNDQKQDQTAAAAVAMDVDLASVDLSNVTHVEWWDKPLLGDNADNNNNDNNNNNNNNNNNDNTTTGYWSSCQQGGKIQLADDVVTHFVEHPVPVKPLVAPRAPPPLPVMLTKIERKKLRKRRRAERQQEERELVLLGVKEPPKPKVRLSNMMRVLGTEAVQDPTALERMVRKEADARRAEHDQRNQERKLTASQRKEKKRRKLVEDADEGVNVAVFRIRDLSHPQRRFKVDATAKSCHMTGCALVHPAFSLVVVEGGVRAIRKYKKLMLQRIDWAADLPILSAKYQPDQDNSMEARAAAQAAGADPSTLSSAPQHCCCCHVGRQH